MPSCEQVRDLLSPLLDERLEDDERLAVEGHLTACWSCTAEWEGLHESMSLLDDLPRLELSPELIERTMSALTPRQRHLRRWRRVGLPLLLAAGLLVGVGVVLLIGASLSDAPASGSRIASSSETTALPRDPTPRPPHDLPPPFSRQRARTELAIHVALLEPFAQRVAHLEGRDPSNEMALVQTSYSPLRERTRFLIRNRSALPEAQLYLDNAASFVSAVDSSVKARPDALVVYQLRTSVSETGVLDTLPLNYGLTTAQVTTASDVSPEVRDYVIGQIHYSNGAYPEAVQHFNSYTAGQPTNGVYNDAAHFLNASANAKLGNHEDAAFNYFAVLNNPVYASAAQDGLRQACLNFRVVTVDGASCAPVVVNGSLLINNSLENVGNLSFVSGDRKVLITRPGLLTFDLATDAFEVQGSNNAVKVGVSLRAPKKVRLLKDLEQRANGHR